MNKYILIGLICMFILNGLCNTFISKLLVKQESYTNKEQTFKDFYIHPFFQSMFMFVAEFLCLIIAFILLLIKKIKYEKDKKVLQPYWYIIPSVFDAAASSFLHYGYVFALPSIIQMMTALNVITAAILSYIFLGKRFNLIHYIGLIIILVGVIIVVISSIITTTKKDKDSTNALGIIMLVCANILSPTQYIIEERLFKVYGANPLEAVGYEGCVGMMIMFILLIIFQNIHVASVPNLFPFKTIENVGVAMIQIYYNRFILIIIIIYVLNLAMFNAEGLAITKYLSALSRTTINVFRTAITWVVSLFIHWETFSWIELIGFVISTIGVFTYNFEPSVKSKDKNVENETNNSIQNVELNK